MTDGVRMAVAGAGLIGRCHVEEGAGCRSTRLAAVVDPAAAVVLTSAGGALGTSLLSDVAASPRSWEQTLEENASCPSHPDEDCHHVAGTAGSLSVPPMRLRAHPGRRSWWEPFETSTVEVRRRNPLARQVEHFAAVVRGEAEPVCSGRDGLGTLQVVRGGRRVRSHGGPGRPAEVRPEPS